MNTQKIIENFLISCKTWVLAKTLCDELGITPRSLRAGGINDITAFTISGDLGYKFYKYATDQEFLEFYNRVRAQALASFSRVARMRRMRLSDQQMEMVS